MIFDRGMDFDTAYRVLRIRFWEKGHSFEDIDSMTLQDFGDILAYWHETDRAKEKLRKSKVK